jgi:hypothetical protein
MTTFSHRFLSVIFLVLILVISPSVGAWAQSITIDNYSFESPSTNTSITGVVTGWVASPARDGVESNQGSVFVAGGDGDQMAWIHAPGRLLSQVVDATIQPGNTYILSALVGTWVTSDLATYHVQLYDYTQNVLLAEANGTPNIGSFATVSTQYIANNPAYYGDTLQIVLTNSGSYATEICYDNISLVDPPLAAVVIPIPPTVLLLGSSLAGLGLLRLRKRA